eukprot:SM000153S01593  [mRNA]  locus=s153:147320:147817:+ [translate_table: standard]
MRAVDEADGAQLWEAEVHLDQSVTICNAASRRALLAGAVMEPVRLAGPDRPHVFTMWTIGRDEGGGFFALRPVNRPEANLDATKDGRVILHPWKKGANQMWGFYPKGESSPIHPL